MDEIRDLLLEHCAELTAVQREKLGQYYALLAEGNRRMNLTAITEPRDVIEKHFADSLLAVSKLKEGARCIDIGTGAGFPGIPLLIARPDLQMTLLDSLQKRVRFLEDTLGALGLSARLLHARAEEAAKKPEMREVFDAALSRAVAPLRVLLELSVPFVRTGGAIIAYKGRAAEEEAEAAKNAAKTHFLTLTVEWTEAAYGQRALITAVKGAATPARFPRRPGEASRYPL